MFNSTGANTHYTINEIFYIIYGRIQWVQDQMIVLNFEEYRKITLDLLNKYIEETNLSTFERYIETNEWCSIKLGTFAAIDNLISTYKFYIIPYYISSQFYLLVLALFVFLIFYVLYTNYATYYFILTNTKKVEFFINILYSARMFITTKSKTFIFPIRLNTNISLMTHLYVLLFLNNVVGLIPYNNNLTSQFVNVWLSALIIIVYLIVQLVEMQGFNYLKRYPKIDNYWYTSIYPFVMGAISHVFRIFSLSMRVFINMFAGHLLLGIFEHYIPILII
jgi:F0F1-type ATP synthase membrane subunit a